MQPWPSSALPTCICFLVIFIGYLSTPAIAATDGVQPSALTLERLNAASRRPTSALASKFVYQSPPVDNIYKELIVSSKPLHLRKYKNNIKTKKNKKDSRIYYIPIPPLPYRYIPGVGYDYTPMKINPILVEMPIRRQDMPLSTRLETNARPPLGSSYLPPSSSLQFSTAEPPTTRTSSTATPTAFPQPTSTLSPTVGPIVGKVNASSTEMPSIKDSRVYNLRNHHYFFNGRPFRLQVAHADPHTRKRLNSHNLKSNLYFDKPIIH